MRSVGFRPEITRSFLAIALTAGLGLQTIANGQRAASSAITTVWESEYDNVSLSLQPGINASGEVAFGDGVRNLFVGDGRSLRLVYTSGVHSLEQVGGPADINSSGTVVFHGIRIGGDRGIFAGSGNEPTLIAQLSGLWTANNPTINNRGVVAFALELNSVFTSFNETLTTIASASGHLWGFDAPTINDRGQVAFHARYRDGGAGIFIGDGQTLDVVADSSGPLTFDGSFGRRAVVNNAGEVAFAALQDNGTEGVFVWRHGSLRTVAKVGVDFAWFTDDTISINDNGTVAFIGISPSRRAALYTNDHGQLRRVIGVGDSLSGATIQLLGFGWSGLNEAGQLAFGAVLDDDRGGIYRAR